jgi:hypothetical protein
MVVGARNCEVVGVLSPGISGEIVRVEGVELGSRAAFVARLRRELGRDLFWDA